jgi:hypothetical protein
MILIFALATVASPSPSPTPKPADPCGSTQVNLLAALNRPSIGYSACTITPGQNVDELGYQNTVGSGADVAAYPQGFLRFGLVPDLEFDLIGPAYGVSALGGSRSAGFFDTGIGAKYRFWHDTQRALAVDFLYTAPTGAGSFTAGGPTATLNLDYSMPLAGRLGLATTVGAQRAAGFSSVLPSAVVSYQWNARAQAFIEAFGQTHTSPQGGSLFGMDAAMQYLLTPDLEFDVEIGRTVSTDRRHYVGFGLGARF